MVTAERDGDRIVLATQYRDRNLVKQVPGARWDANTQQWSMPLSWAGCRQLRGIFGDRLDVGPELTAWGWDQYRVWEERRELRERAMDPANDTDGDARLFPYQRTGSRFLATAKRAILADEMGTGKTVQTIMTLEQTDAYPALVVCPNTVKTTWRDEYATWAPHRRVQVIQGGAATRRKQIEAEADVYVINWESLRRHSRLAPYGSIRLKACGDCGGSGDVPPTKCEKHPGELNRPWGAVVADEAHRAKDPTSKQTRALWWIGRQADVRLALTGTPLANAPDDLWSLLHFCEPDEWPARTRYIDRYCATSWNAWGGVDVIGIKPELREEFFGLVDPMMLRRPKELVLPHLPPKVRQRREVPMKPKQRKAYKDLVERMLAEVDGGVVVAPDPLTNLTRASQFASAYAEMDEDGGIRLAEPSNKVDALVELLDDSEGPLVVFAASRQLIELCEARLQKLEVPFGSIHGKVSEGDRDLAKAQFQSGQLKVLLCTLGAGAEGLTLTRADTVVFLQRSWSLIENRQAEDRVHRPGQEADSVFIIDVVSPGTADEGAIAVLGEKADRFEEVVRDADALARFLKGEV